MSYTRTLDSVIYCASHKITRREPDPPKFPKRNLGYPRGFSDVNPGGVLVSWWLWWVDEFALRVRLTVTGRRAVRLRSATDSEATPAAGGGEQSEMQPSARVGRHETNGPAGPLTWPIRTKVVEFWSKRIWTKLDQSAQKVKFFDRPDKN